MKPHDLLTPRLRLRRFDGRHAGDPGFLLDILNQPSFLRFIGDRGVRSLAAARDYIAMGPINSYERHGFGMHVVELLQSGASIGLCGLVKRDSLPDPDLGYALLPAHCGKGYAAEAAVAVLGHARDTLRMERVLAVTDPANAPSIALLLKLGFVPRGTTQLAPGEQRLQLYAIDWTGKLRA